MAGVGSQSPNQREGLSAVSSATSNNEYVYSTNHALNVSVVSGGSSGTQYAELTTTAPGTGTLSLGRYKTVAPTLTDGQMYGLQLDSSGNLKVTGSLSVGGTTDNSAFTAGSSTGTPTMGFYHSTIDTVTDGRAAAVGITSKRALLVNLQTAAGVETGVAAAPLQVSLANTAANGTAVKVDGTGGTFPISGTVTATQGTAAAVTAGWPIIQGQLADTTGTFTNATQTTSVTASSLNGYETITVSITGTFTVATAVFEVSDDAGTTWYGAQGARSDSSTIESGYTTLTTTTRMWVIPINGGDSFRVRSTAVATGTVSVRISPTAGATADSAIVSLGAALPAGSAVIGALTANQSVNTAQINGVTPLMGNGVTGTGSQRVTIASDNTAFAVNSTLSAETTKVIGTVRNVGNAGATFDSTIGAGTAPANQIVTGAIYNSTEISPTTGQAFAIQADSKGRQRQVIMDAAGNTRGANVTVANAILVDLSATTANATAIKVDASGATINTALSQIGAAAVSAGNGVSGTGVQRMTLASDSTGQVAPAANATSTGVSINFQTALTNSKIAVKASAGNMYGWHIYNPNNAVTYIQLFNLASASVTLGTTAPTMVLVVPAQGGIDDYLPVPITFGTAITLAATTTASGLTAPTSTLVADFFFA